VTSEGAAIGLAASSAARTRYEQVRRHVLSAKGSEQGAPGLALLLRHGLRAYLEATAEAASTTTPPIRMERPMGIEDGLRSEIARVMAAMALGAAAPREARA